jgi:hypothetical protein
MSSHLYENDERLGPLVSQHQHTWLYRVIAVVIGALFLTICLAMGLAGDGIAALASAAAVSTAVAVFIRSQASDRLFLHDGGLCLQRGKLSYSIRWVDIANLDITWAYSGDPPGFFEAIFVDNNGRRIVLRANWQDRESIDYLLLALAEARYPGRNMVPR